MAVARVKVLPARRRAHSTDSGNRLGLALLCVALVAIFGVSFQNFFSVSNLFVILLNTSSIAIAGIGAGFLLISGNVDLSIGGQYGLIGVVTAIVARNTQSPPLAVAT